MGQHVQSILSEESFYSSSDNDEIWRLAEEKAAALLSWIQPSKQSEECRKGVINYVTSLLEREIVCKVFSFGSVPLKTYLPDGDIDLTVISPIAHFNQQPDAWATRVREILEHEERIHVKEVKCIRAKVPVVKCLVENIIVDITFNQLGGLSTLCFLEEVDGVIGKDHLFKRSIILVKAWCFYESRILGAHHGLLSTYALEVLVLYIFHVYQLSLHGPFEVLFRFIRFFSQFDWEKFGLSPWGPVPVDELHDMIEVPLNAHGDALFSKGFLENCRNKYRTLPENNHGLPFERRPMNLVDPLRPSNNLGRSVNSGNLVRIYSAFAYGAARLEKLLLSPKHNVFENLALFFCNTQKHCEGQRPDIGFLSFQGAILCNRGLETGDLTAGTYGLKTREAYRTAANQLACDGCILGHDSLAESVLSSSIDHSNVHTDDALVYLADGKGNLSISDLFLNSNAVPINFDSWSELQLTDSCPSITSSSAVSKDCKADSDSQKDLSSPSSTPKLNSASSHLSDTASVGSEEELLQWQAVSYEGDLGDKFDCRDAQVAFLDGDYVTYLDNLECGRAFQTAYPQPFSWKFVQSIDRRNVPFHGGTPLPNGAIIGSLIKNQKGTGTFLPPLRDKRGHPNRQRSPQRNMDSLNAANSHLLPASKSRLNGPRRRDGALKAKSRRTTDLAAGRHRELSMEDSVKDMVQSSNMVAHDTTISFPGQVDSGAQMPAAVDSSLKSQEISIVQVTQGKRNLFIENLEFGSFGAGFLAGDLHSGPQHREGTGFVNHSQQHLWHHESASESMESTSESMNVAPKTGKNSHPYQSSYHMKEEDFPPLPLICSNAAKTERAATLSQASYQQACVQSSSSVTKGP